jgi:hypothetical protein
MEGISERLGYAADAFIDAKIQNKAQYQGNPEVQKLAEPIKGKAIDGRPIVVAGTGNVPAPMFDAQTLVIAGGIIAAALTAVLLLRK